MSKAFCSSSPPFLSASFRSRSDPGAFPSFCFGRQSSKSVWLKYLFMLSCSWCLFFLNFFTSVLIRCWSGVRVVSSSVRLNLFLQSDWIFSLSVTGLSAWTSVFGRVAWFALRLVFTFAQKRILSVLLKLSSMFAAAFCCWACSSLYATSQCFLGSLLFLMLIFL